MYYVPPTITDLKSDIVPNSNKKVFIFNEHILYHSFPLRWPAKRVRHSGLIRRTLFAHHKTAVSNLKRELRLSFIERRRLTPAQSFTAVSNE